MIVSSADRLKDISTYYFAQKLAEIETMNQNSDVHVINLGIGSPDLQPPSIAIESVKQSISSPTAHQYQSYKGITSLRNAFSSWYKTQFEIDINPQTEILPLIGSKEGILHISMSFLNFGDTVLVPNPGYPSYAACTKLAGGIAVDMPLEAQNGWLPDLDALAATDLSKVKLMWINYPNMPTGARADIGYLNDLVSFALQFRILICHDNPYHFILNDDVVSIFNAKDADQCALELVSLSKCYNMAGWRVGALIGRKDYIDTVMTFKSNMDSGMFKPIQEGAASALMVDAAWAKDLNAAYSKRKKIACQIMDLIGASYDKNGAGLFIWGNITSSGMDGQSLSQQLLESSRVFITPGFVFGSQGQNYLRISLCSTEQDLTAALYRIQTGYRSSDSNHKNIPR